MNRRNMTLVGILSAISLALELLIHFPVLAQAPYLLVSPGDLPMFIAAMVIEPLAGVVCAFINATLFVVLTGQGGPWGALMHFIASGAMAFIIGRIYKNTGKTLPALGAGILTRIALMVPLNLAITPLYTGMPREAVMKMIVPVVIPFNTIHALFNATLCYIVLKALPEKVVNKAAHSQIRTP